MARAWVILFVLTAVIGVYNSGYATIFDTDDGDLHEPEPSTVYDVSQSLSLSLQFGGATLTADTEIWDAVTAVLPDELLKSELAEFHIFTDGEDELLAYVSQLERDVDKWLFAIDSVDAQNKQSKAFVTTVTHEFAHILALENDEVDAGVEEFDCPIDFWIEEGCPSESSQILAFFDTFWRGDLYQEHRQLISGLVGEDKDDAVADFYDSHLDKFINEYSATDPIEDFAESFSYFVFLDPIHKPFTMRERKINYFHSVPAFVAARDYIRAQTDIRRGHLDE